MSFITTTRFYFNLFYILGLSSYCPRSSSTFLSLFEYAKYVQAAICFCGATSCMLILHSDEGRLAYTNTEICILTLYALCEFIRIVVVLFQAIAFAPHLTEVVRMLREQEVIFAQHLHHRLNYRKFVEKLHQRMLGTIGLMIVYISLFFLRMRIGDQSITRMNVVSKYLQLTTAACAAHVLFYVELLNFCLAELNMAIQRSSFESRSSVQDIKDRLLTFKTVHFRLYLVRQKINRFFGYSILALLLHAFTELLYSAFWLFDTIESKRGLLALWSKFFGGIEIQCYFIQRFFVF